MIRMILGYAAAFALTVLLCLAVRDALPGPAGAVIVGILMGLISAVPTSILLISLLRRNQRGPETQLTTSRSPQPPPVIVVDAQLLDDEVQA